MTIPHNFKEIRITPNADNTFKMEYFGVTFQDKNGEQLESTVSYPRVKLSTSNFCFHPTKQSIDIELLADVDNTLQNIYILEET